MNIVNLVEINNFKPELLEELGEVGWAVIKGGLSGAICRRLKRPLKPLLWEPKFVDNPNYRRYKINYHNQIHMMARQGPMGWPNFVMAALKCQVQAHGHAIRDEAFANWGNDTWGLTDRLKAIARTKMPTAIPVTEADRKKLQLSGGFHIIEPGGSIEPHQDGDSVETMNAVAIVDHDPEADAGLSFSLNPDGENPWITVSGQTGDILLINHRLQPWHRMTYADSADRPRMTFMVAYHRMAYHFT